MDPLRLARALHVRGCVHGIPPDIELRAFLADDAGDHGFTVHADARAHLINLPRPGRTLGSSGTVSSNPCSPRWLYTSALRALLRKGALMPAPSGFALGVHAVAGSESQEVRPTEVDSSGISQTPANDCAPDRAPKVRERDPLDLADDLLRAAETTSDPGPLIATARALVAEVRARDTDDPVGGAARTA